MKAAVIDTNVAVVANGRTAQASPDCVLSCLRALRETVDTGIVVLDDGVRILKEYMANLSLAGQPGPGDAFLKWLWEHQANPERCEQVHITPKPDNEDDFEEFPADRDLEGFDRADRKFAAVARTSQLNPRVLNAVDSDWWVFRRSLQRYGIHIEFLCPDHVQRERKPATRGRRTHGAQ